MDLTALLQLVAEFRRRAAAAAPEEQADLIFLADEYEAAAKGCTANVPTSISVKLPL